MNCVTGANGTTIHKHFLMNSANHPEAQQERLHVLGERPTRSHSKG